MKSRSYLLATLAVIIGLGAYAAVRFNQENNEGLGARDSTASIPGESREIAFVANSLSGTVSLIDLESLRVLTVLDVTPEGLEVGFFRDPLQSIAQGYVEGRAGKNYVQDTDVSRDGEVLFVSRGYLADIAAFEIESGEMLWRTSVPGLRSDHMDITPDGKRLFASSIILSGNSVQIIDTESGRVEGVLEAGQWPHDVQVNSDGSEVYVASLGNMLAEEVERSVEQDAYTITHFNSQTLERIAQYQFPAGVRPFHVSTDGSLLHAQLSNTHDVVLFDTKAGEIIARQTLPIDDGVTEADWDFEAPHHGLAVTPDESTLCIAGRASDYAALMDARSLAVESVIEVGNAPSWAAINAAGSLCVVPNTRSDSVSVIDIASRRVIATIEVQSGPKHVSIGHVPLHVLDSINPQ